MKELDFQEQFAAAIQAGRKSQTIRRAAPCRPGEQLLLVTGTGTAAYRPLRPATCTGVTPVKIGPAHLELNGQPLPNGIIRQDEFARQDGFASYREMAAWFENRYGALPFEGFLIEWQ
jgi:hypothetical protein